MKPLHRATAILLLAIGLFAATGGAGANAAGAGLTQPTASCSAGRASVTFAWRPLPGSSQQWLDVGNRDNGFARGTFESQGPMDGSTTSYVWDGLKSGERIYWRVNSLTADGWLPSDTGSYTPCAATAAGVNYVFGTNVSSADQAAVRDAIKNASDYGKEVLGFEPSTYTVHAYQDVGELADALARWAEDPSPATIDAIKQRYSDSRIVILGSVIAGDGMFITTWTDAWTRSRTYRHLVISHEYFHIVQAALMGGTNRRGTPLWLSEGSAELFGMQAYARKTGAEYSGLRSAYIRELNSVTESLIALEAGGRFRETANDSYPLAMLAVEFLIKDRGWQGMVDYFKAIGARVEWHKAFSDSFGVAYDSFASAFENYRQNGYRP
jgi:hypothetical protein